MCPQVTLLYSSQVEPILPRQGCWITIMLVIEHLLDIHHDKRLQIYTYILLYKIAKNEQIGGFFLVHNVQLSMK